MNDTEGNQLANRLKARLAQAEARPVRGQVAQAIGVVVRAKLEEARIGDLCWLTDPNGEEVLAEVVALDGREAILSPFGGLRGLSTLTQVRPSGKPLEVLAGPHMLGQVLDAFGRAEGLKPSPEAKAMPVYREAPDPMSRNLIKEPLPTGLRVIDGLLTCAAGQRIGLFGGPGLGKSTLMNTLAGNASCDVCVAALIGERGREVREFRDVHLSPQARARTIVLAATSDRPAAERILAGFVATAIAEYFSDQGLKVMLVFDSLTRLARAQREVGLAAGEPPARRGFPPSVFSLLPQIVERAGPSSKGSITAFYTVLVEGELTDDPVAEEAKALLDGHIILSNKLAQAGMFPAVDVLNSRSRLMTAVASEQHIRAAEHMRNLMSKHAEIELLLQIGEYKAGSDKVADEAIAKIDRIKKFLKQHRDEMTPFNDTRNMMFDLAR